MTQASNLLSQEEIDALTESIQDGTIPVDTGYNMATRVRKHDLTNEDSSLGVNVSSLDMINERFIRLFRLSLLEVLRTSPRINPSRVALVKFGDYMKNLNAPLSVNVIRMNPLRGNALVLIDPNVIFNSLDNFFGGFGRGIGQLTPSRLFTPTETRVISIILDVLFSSLKEAWSPLLSIDFETVSSEINPHFAQIVDENDLVIVNHFDAEFGDGNGFIDVVYPYSALKPIRDLQRNLNMANAENESLKLQEIKFKVARKNLDDWKYISLPQNQDDAQRLYREWVHELTRQCGFSGPGFEVTPGARSQQKEFGTVGVEVKKAETDLQGLTRFLFLFDQADMLQRISAMKIDSPGAQGNPRLLVSKIHSGRFWSELNGNYCELKLLTDQHGKFSEGSVEPKRLCIRRRPPLSYCLWRGIVRRRHWSNMLTL